MAKDFGRRVTHNWMITEWLMGGDPDLRLVEMRAQRFLRVDSEVAFEEGVDTVRDGTACGVARRGATRNPKSGDWEHSNTCRKSDDICSQPAFLEKERDRAKAAATALEASSRKADREMGERANALLTRTPTDASKGKACYGSGGLGGDISIALECGADETLVSTDASFDLICPAIGVEYRRPT